MVNQAGAERPPAAARVGRQQRRQAPRPSLLPWLRYGLVGLGVALLTLLALELLLGQRLASQRREQLLADLTMRLRLGEVALERFTPEGLAEISGLRLAVGGRPEPRGLQAPPGRWPAVDPWLRRQSQELRLGLCGRLGRCPALLPSRIGPRGVWVRMESPLELATPQDPVWLFMPVPATPWWPPDPLLLTMALACGGLAATLLHLTLEVQRPLLRLERGLTAVRLETGAASPLPLRGSAAVRRLTARFNSMVAGLERAGRERATMLAGIAHDLRAPLTRLRLRCDLAGGAGDPGGRERLLADLDVLERITGQFLLFAGAERAEEPVLLPLHALVAEAAAGMEDVELDLEPLLRRVRPTALARAIANLLENAISHGQPPLRLELRGDGGDPTVPSTASPGAADDADGEGMWQATAAAGGQGFQVVVWDGGPGIAAAAWPLALEAFQRLDPARGGRGHCGLGLAIAERVARDHGGHLSRMERAGAFGVALSGRSLEAPDPA